MWLGQSPCSTFIQFCDVDSGWDSIHFHDELVDNVILFISCVHFRSQVFSPRQYTAVLMLLP